MYTNKRSTILYQDYPPPRSSSGSVSSGYSSDEPQQQHQQQQLQSPYSSPSTMASHSQGPLRHYVDPRAAQQASNQDAATQAYGYSNTQGGQQQDPQVYHQFYRSTQAIGQRHDRAGGPPYNPFGYGAVHRDSPSGSTSTYNYGVSKRPDDLVRTSKQRK